MAAFYRRRLPHLQYNQGTYFITFGLAGSLPQRTIEYLRQEQQRLSYSPKRERIRSSKMYFKKYDHLLEGGKGPLWLKKKEIADIVSSKIHDLNGEEYNLLCYTIMPNHVHLLFQLSESRAEAFGTWDPGCQISCYPYFETD